MKKAILFLILGILVIEVNVFADDVFIDSDGNVETGVSNTNANLEVTGASAEDAINGSTSGTGAAAVYGIRTDNNNYGMLGYDNHGVYGYSLLGYAGYFEGDTYITGNLTVDGSIGYTETDPVFSGWDKSTGISITESQITDLNHFTTGNETDPVFLGSPAFGITSVQITNWDSAFGWGDHSTADYDSSDDAWTGTGDVYTTSGNVGIGTSSPSERLTVAGTIESTTGGIKFPNGTVQTTAIAAGQQCVGGEVVTGFDNNGNIICSNAITYAIGDLGPAGGIVFYIYGGGLHGMEAATEDQSIGAAWGCEGTEITGADGTASGTGAQNTADILAGCTDSGIAAEIADSYSLNGYDDWFLPSKDELGLLYQQKDVVGNFADNYYWSSTESGSGSAWSQHFFNGYWHASNKSDLDRVRAVRAF